MGGAEAAAKPKGRRKAAAAAAARDAAAPAAPAAAPAVRTDADASESAEALSYEAKLEECRRVRRDAFFEWKRRQAGGLSPLAAEGARGAVLPVGSGPSPTAAAAAGGRGVPADPGVAAAEPASGPRRQHSPGGGNRSGSPPSLSADEAYARELAAQLKREAVARGPTSRLGNAAAEEIAMDEASAAAIAQLLESDEAAAAGAGAGGVAGAASGASAAGGLSDPGSARRRPDDAFRERLIDARAGGSPFAIGAMLRPAQGLRTRTPDDQPMRNPFDAQSSQHGPSPRAPVLTAASSALRPPAANVDEELARRLQQEEYEHVAAGDSGSSNPALAYGGVRQHLVSSGAAAPPANPSGSVFYAAPPGAVRAATAGGGARPSGVLQDVQDVRPPSWLPSGSLSGPQDGVEFAPSLKPAPQPPSPHGIVPRRTAVISPQVACDRGGSDVRRYAPVFRQAEAASPVAGTLAPQRAAGTIFRLPASLETAATAGGVRAGFSSDGRRSGRVGAGTSSWAAQTHSPEGGAGTRLRVVSGGSVSGWHRNMAPSFHVDRARGPITSTIWASGSTGFASAEGVGSGGGDASRLSSAAAGGDVRSPAPTLYSRQCVGGSINYSGVLPVHAAGHRQQSSAERRYSHGARWTSSTAAVQPQLVSPEARRSPCGLEGGSLLPSTGGTRASTAAGGGGHVTSNAGASGAFSSSTGVGSGGVSGRTLHSFRSPLVLGGTGMQPPRAPRAGLVVGSRT